MKIIKPQTFSPGGFSRASSATYYNDTGTLTTAGVDVLRVGYNPTTLDLEGAIVESSATNYLPYSNDFLISTGSGWSTSGTVSITAAAAISPTGALNASLFSTGISITWVLSVPNPVFSLYVKPVSPPSYPATTSAIRLNKATGAGTTTFNFYSDHAPTVTNVIGGTYSVQTLPNGWYRVSTQSVGSATAFVISRVAGQFYMYGAQAESGLAAAPSSYISSSGSSTTRAADILTGTPPSVVFSNVEEDDAPVWSSATSYVAGNQAIVLSTYHRVYEALTSNTNKFPPNNPSDWLDTGPTNTWQMLDMESGIERQTVANAADETITISLAVEGPVSSVVLLNIEGGEVSITVKDEDGTVIGEVNESILGFPRSMLLFSDFNLPIGETGSILVTVTGGGSPARVGKLIVGEEVYIGCTKYGSSGGIIDFSRKQRDDFGNTTIVERRYIDKFDYDIQIETVDAYTIKNFLASIRAIPAVYIGSENHLVTVVFGFYRDFSIVLQGPVKSACSLQVEGI